MSQIHFSNDYGQFDGVLLGEAVDISKVTAEVGTRWVNDGLGLTIEQAEQIALIEGNRRLQLCLNGATGLFYVIYHHSASQVQAMSIQNLCYVGPNAQQEISDLARPGW